MRTKLERADGPTGASILCYPQQSIGVLTVLNSGGGLGIEVFQIADTAAGDAIIQAVHAGGGDDVFATAVGAGIEGVYDSHSIAGEADRWEQPARLDEPLYPRQLPAVGCDPVAR